MKKNKLSVVIASSIVFASFFGSANASETLDDTKDIEVEEDYSIQTLEIKPDAEAERIMKLKSNTVSNKQLSQTRMEILQKKLEQNLEKEELGLLKAQGDRAEAEKKLNLGGVDPLQPNAKNGSSGGNNGDDNDGYQYGFDVEEELVEDYGLLSEKYNLEQNVGFVYKTKSEVMEELINSEEFISMQNQKDEDAMALLDVEEEVYVPPSSKVTSAVIKRIASFGVDKTAKIEFNYSVTDGDSLRTGKKMISVTEGSSFILEYETFKTIKISGEGVLLRNTNTNKDMLVLKSL